MGNNPNREMTFTYKSVIQKARKQLFLMKKFSNHEQQAKRHDTLAKFITDLFFCDNLKEVFNDIDIN